MDFVLGVNLKFSAISEDITLLFFQGLHAPSSGPLSKVTAEVTLIVNTARGA